VVRPSRHLRAALAAAAIVTFVGCTDPAAFASPSAVAVANPTPRPTQAVPSRPAPTRSATPSPTASLPVATPQPHSNLEDLLPDFTADGQSTSKRTMTAQELAGDSQTSGFVDRILAPLGRPRTAIEVAVANGSFISFTAVRVDGAPGDQLSEAIVKAFFTVHRGTEVPADVDGHKIRWLQFQDENSFPVDDARIFTTGDVVVVLTARKEDAALALATLKWMFKPRLDAVLPAAVDGHALQRLYAPAAAFNLGGDICSFLCPAEVAYLANAVGARIDDMDVAIAYEGDPPGLLVVAFGVPGTKAEALVDGRIKSGGHAGGSQVVPTKVSVGGKAVTWVNYSPFDSETEREYLYAIDGTLFSIRPAPLIVSDGPSPLVEKLIAALP
jgi:hypothetical protein